MPEKAGSGAHVSIEKGEAGTLLIRFSGTWTIKDASMEVEGLLASLAGYLPVQEAVIDAENLQAWDSYFISILAAVQDFFTDHGIKVRFSGLSEGADHMIRLASRPGLSEAVIPREAQEAFLERMGQGFQKVLKDIREFHEFLGEVVLGVISLFSGKNRIRYRDFFVYVQNAGARALPIVSMVSFLVGLILAFVATVQLKLFGAQIYVADLVGIAMARDMGAMMCGIIMAGRTGATYAAELGTMQVNEEIDAFLTLGINPVDFLVVPRILALALMMPLLCIYADLLGIAGGAVVGAGFSDITLRQYINETQTAVPMTHFFIGIVKCFIYGLIVAIVGCRKGLSSGRSAAAVGRVTTSAVVTSIVWIILVCAVITVICYVLGI